MKKTIIFYGRRNVGMLVLPFLVANGYEVKVMSDDASVQWTAAALGLEMVELETMGKFDLFLSVHGTRIIPKEYLEQGIFVNVHPCLSLGYKGHNPIKRYIEDKKELGSVEAHFMTEVVDEGEIIHQEFFNTGVCRDFADFYNIAYRYYLHCIYFTLQKLNL